MKRLAIALTALLLVFGGGLMPAAASGSDDDRSGSGSRSSGSDDEAEDAEDDAEDAAEDAEDAAEDAEDAREDPEDDDADDDSGHHRRRHRHRHRNRGGDDGVTSGGTGGSAGGTGTGGSGSQPVSSATVDINDRSFSPSTVNLATGGTVTWKNVSREHTVTANDDSFDSGVIDTGQEFSQTFDTEGTFAYRCLIHTEMTGKVVVGSAKSTAASAAPSASGGGGTGRTGSTASTSASAAGRPTTRGGNSGLPALGTVERPLTAAATSAEVDVTEFAFAPEDVTIAPGGTVRWMLVGDAPHTVTSDTFDSGMLKPGDTYEQTFDDVGTVDYRCDFHPEMTATVTVAESAPPPDTGGAVADRGGGGTDDGGDPPARSAQLTAGGGLANTGLGGVPALLGALAIILAGWAALVTGRRTMRGRRTV